VKLKVIEVCYDVASIPGCNPSNPPDARATRFRDAAQRVVEDALLLAGVGAGVGSDVGDGEVRFRLAVNDFDAAERAIWEAVWSTPYAKIREILRYWDADLAA
jgi:hypothetical protein